MAWLLVSHLPSDTPDAALNSPFRGICFTYAAMFALESLSLAGEVYDNSASVRKACEFLVKHQMDDGGWGETYMVCGGNRSACNAELNSSRHPVMCDQCLLAA